MNGNVGSAVNRMPKLDWPRLRPLTYGSILEMGLKNKDERLLLESTFLDKNSLNERAPTTS